MNTYSHLTYTLLPLQLTNLSLYVPVLLYILVKHHVWLFDFCGNSCYDIQWNLCNPTLGFSGTCAIRHLGFPTSCDIQQKLMVPKYISSLKQNLSIPTFCRHVRFRQVPLYHKISQGTIAIRYLVHMYCRSNLRHNIH